MNRACAWSACASFSAGLSRGSWMARAAAMTTISGRHPSSRASRIIRESRGSRGSLAMILPRSVRRQGWVGPRSSFSSGSIAPISRRISIPSRTLFCAGRSMNGKASISPRFRASIRRITPARLERRISGGV